MDILLFPYEFFKCHEEHDDVALAGKKDIYG